MKSVKKQVFTQGAIALAVSLLFQPHATQAQQPTGAQVVNGAASISQNGSTLNVTNSPGTIINWQGFSIGAGNVTNFIQQSASSAVLNRVVGRDISSIQGQLLSNGRVFLINPAGIVVGPGAMIDTAGFVGSTLNMQNADFLAGKLRFSGDATSGAIINQGWIRTSYGGNVLLVAPRIENSGLIQTPAANSSSRRGKNSRWQVSIRKACNLKCRRPRTPSSTSASCWLPAARWAYSRAASNTAATYAPMP